MSSRPHYNIRILSVVPTAVNLPVIIRQLLKTPKNIKNRKIPQKREKSS